jgi:hypothetical protein
MKTLKIATLLLWLVALGLWAERLGSPWMAVVVAMQEPVPVPAPPGEQRLPPGDFCTHVVPGQPAPKHPCTCHRVVIDEMCEGTPVEDRVCKTYCKMEACRCPVHCQIPPEGAPAEPTDGEEPQIKHAH